ncbi:photosystem II stability/assembly factor-like protein [Pseudomonas cavernae]|uniref:Photosystem II stability/assembly factor-like protein n=2 Tax=Pseudomonas cavernae TaxID=2320867 RepID=A0A385Z3E2_9PSED|nr:photosystem II stability/assembly factor-like protein [Pseudomonas cavernae]
MLSDIARAGQRLVTVGARGHILYSDDEGNSWQQAQVPVSVTLTGVCFADDRRGWAVGHRGVILATGDAGQTWSLQLQGHQVASALVDEARRQQSDLLDSAEMLVADGADKPFLDIHCAGTQQATAVGAYGLVLRTEDGGQHWQPSLAALRGTDQRHINAITAAPEGLYLAGEQGGLYRAGSDLATVQVLAEPYDGSFFGLLTSADGALIAYGLRGHVFRWQGANSEWQQIALRTTQSLTAGALLGSGAILLADASGAGWYSQDAGRTFRLVKPENQFSFTALTPLQDGSVLAVGLRGITRFQATDLE